MPWRPATRSRDLHHCAPGGRTARTDATLERASDTSHIADGCLGPRSPPATKAAPSLPRPRPSSALPPLVTPRSGTRASTATGTCVTNAEFGPSAPSPQELRDCCVARCPLAGSGRVLRFAALFFLSPSSTKPGQGQGDVPVPAGVPAFSFSCISRRKRDGPWRLRSPGTCFDHRM